jgi:hypothetical protein
MVHKRFQIYPFLQKGLQKVKASLQAVPVKKRGGEVCERMKVQLC